MIFGLTEYTADISDAYLRKFEEPRESFNAGLKIQMRTIPVNIETPIELYTAIKHACTIPEKAENYGSEGVSMKRRAVADISCNDINNNGGRKRMKGSVGKAQDE